MVEQVVYEMSLRDKLSQGVGQANSAVNRLEKSLGGVVAKGIALFASFQFLKESVSMFNESEQASAQLNATMASTKNIAGLNRDALDKQAESLMKLSLADDDAITGAQSLLATFTNIKGEVFMNTIPAILDMSTKMGTDLKGATLQVGKALQDLSGRGLTMLKKSGVDFSKSQIEIIKNLFATNRVAEAQTLILQELNKEFGGSAKAASEAGTGPFTVLRNEFNNIREEIGGMVVDLGKALMPALKTFVGWIKEGVKWVKEHATTVKALAISLGTAWAAFKIISGAKAIILGIRTALIMMSIAGAGAATATGGFSLAMTTALGPIALMAAAIGGLAFIFTKLAGNIAEAREARNAFLNESVNKELTYMEELTKIKGGGQKGKDAAVAQEKAALKADLTNLQAALKTESNRDRQKEINDSIGEVLQKINMVDRYDQNLITVKKENSSTAVAAKSDVSNKKIKADTNKATGSKAVTINVSIKDLIGTQNINTTNLKEGAGKIKDLVVAALTGAVNDFQIIAEK